MRLILDENELRPLIKRVVTETVEQLELNRAKVDHQIAYPEAKAADLIGVARHVLRDARRRGEIRGARVGRRVVYTFDELMKYLGRCQIGSR
jgi:hypothetical protein